jgi:hypothetical protein
MKNPAGKRFFVPTWLHRKELEFLRKLPSWSGCPPAEISLAKQTQ